MSIRTAFPVPPGGTAVNSMDGWARFCALADKHSDPARTAIQKAEE
jgi:hypothetical protein